MKAAPISRVRGIAAIAFALVATRASAQGPPLHGRLELAGGVTWFGGSSLGSPDANLTAPGGGGYRLFSTANTWTSAVGLDARVGVSLSKRFQVELGASYARPDLKASLSNDAEQASPVVARERVQQFIVDGSLLVHLPRWTFARRAVPFVIAGAGYLRDLHDGQTLAVAGQSFHVGGGVQYAWLTRGAGRLKNLGVRGDVRALARRKGSAVDDRVHVAPAVTAGVFARF